MEYIQILVLVLNCLLFLIYLQPIHRYFGGRLLGNDKIMEKSLLQFVNNSFLFQKKSIETQYSRFGDSKLERELERYRQFSLENAKNKQANKQNLNVLVEGANEVVDENFLKQTALYVHQVIINDPVFKFSLPRHNFSEAMNQYLGMEKTGIDRKALSNAAQYIIGHSKAIKSGFIDFIPLSFLHEPPKEIPIKYSEVSFSDVLPPELLEFFRKNSKVAPIQQRDGHWIMDPTVSLTPSNAIDISFPGGRKYKNYPYMLFDMEVISSDEKTREIKFVQTLPDIPPSQEYFNNWVSQSINQASRRYFDEIFKEISVASSIGATYLTYSEFAYQLLQKSIPLASDLQTDVLNLTMGLDLPLLENISLKQILDVREKDGEAFQNFRIELEKQLRELRTIKEPSELRLKLENATHELTNVQIHEIDKKISSVKKKMFPDAIILVGGLLTTFQAAGIGIPALIYAIQNGYKTYQEYISGVKEKPAFFLWKIAQKK